MQMTDFTSGKHFYEKYGVYPLMNPFYIAELGMAGVYLFLLQNMDCGYRLEPPRRGGSNLYPQSMFLAKISKIFNKFY